MNANEFIFWLKGIVDSTQFMPTKKTWDKIIDVVKEVKLDKNKPSPRDKAVVKRLTELGIPFPPVVPHKENPYEIKCEKEKINGKT